MTFLLHIEQFHTLTIVNHGLIVQSEPGSLRAYPKKRLGVRSEMAHLDSKEVQLGHYF